MSYKKTELEYWVPDWAWCEMPNPGGKTKTGERCRFCQETKKRGNATTYRCVIHNKDLLVTSGSVQKCGACLIFDENASKEEAPEMGVLSETTPAKCVKKAIQDLEKRFDHYRKAKIPEDVAMELAKEDVLKQWS